MERAVILGTELPRAIAVIRSLGRAGIRVVTIDHRLRMPGAYSRYVSESFHESHNAELVSNYRMTVGLIGYLIRLLQWKAY